MYFLSTGDEDHGRQRIGRCTGGSADPFLGTERGTVRQPNYGASEERATLRRWFLHCLSSIVSAEPAPLMDRVSPKLDASADGPEVINKEALRLPSNAWVSLVAADQTPQARLVRWTGAERCQRPRNRRCLQRCSR